MKNRRCKCRNMGVLGHLSPMVKSQVAEDILPGGTNAAGLPEGCRTPERVVVVRTAATRFRLVRYCNYQYVYVVYIVLVYILSFWLQVF